MHKMLSAIQPYITPHSLVYITLIIFTIHFSHVIIIKLSHAGGLITLMRSIFIDCFIIGVEDAVLQLLSNGANLGIKNHLGETAVKRIMPSTLETFLDSCIRSTDGEDVSSQNFSITFDYSLLAPPRPIPHPPQQLQPSETGITFSNHNDAVESISLHDSQGK
jgi:hypothetical protein